MSIAFVACCGASHSSAQNSTGVGSRNTATGAFGGARHGTSTTAIVGARLLDEGTLATVSLLGNDNHCAEDGATCFVYVVEPAEADPDLTYAGNAMVRVPVPMTVMLIEETAAARVSCTLAGLARVNWQDIVETGPTIATLGRDVLQRMSAEALDAAGVRYQLVWCPVAESRTADSNPWGRSWRLRLVRRSGDTRRPTR
jgi:hypothetical protein